MIGRRLSDSEIAELKRIPVEAVLGVLGIATERKGSNVFFPARWRGETESSCEISKDCFYCDFGGKRANTVIDLVMQDQNLDFGKAIHWLYDRFINGSAGSSHAIRPAEPVVSEKSPKWRIIDQEDYTRFERDFWECRRLTADDLRLAGVQSLRIQSVEKPDMKFWVAAHKNIAGGWACFLPRPAKRTGKSFKTVIRPNSLSWIKGNPDLNTLIIAESVIDVLSARRIYQIDADLMSINSTALAECSAQKLLKRPIGYDRIIFALDNDESGEKALEIMLPAVSPMAQNVEIMQYPAGIKDPNDLLEQIDK